MLGLRRQWCGWAVRSCSHQKWKIMCPVHTMSNPPSPLPALLLSSSGGFFLAVMWSIPFDSPNPRYCSSDYSASIYTPDRHLKAYLTLRAKYSRTAASFSPECSARRLQCQRSTNASTRERPSTVSDPDVNTPWLIAPDLARRRLLMKFRRSGSEEVKTCLEGSCHPEQSTWMRLAYIPHPVYHLHDKRFQAKPFLDVQPPGGNILKFWVINLSPRTITST